MKRILSSALPFSLMIFMMTTSAFSQDVDVFVGYSNLQAEGLPNRNTPWGRFNTEFFRDRTTLHGFIAAVTGYPTSAFGITGDFSFNRKERNDDFSGGSSSIKTDVYYFMAGPQVGWRSSSRLEPFARILAGGAHTGFEANVRQVVANGEVRNSFD